MSALRRRTDAASRPKPHLSVVVPMFDEEGTVDELHRRLTAVLLATGAPVFLEHGPLLPLSAALLQTGIGLVGLGVVAEMLTRIYFDGRRRRIYTVERSIRRPSSTPIGALVRGEAAANRRSGRE